MRTPTWVFTHAAGITKEDPTSGPKGNKKKREISFHLVLVAA